MAGGHLEEQGGLFVALGLAKNGLRIPFLASARQDPLVPMIPALSGLFLKQPADLLACPQPLLSGTAAGSDQLANGI